MSVVLHRRGSSTRCYASGDASTSPSTSVPTTTITTRRKTLSDLSHEHSIKASALPSTLQPLGPTPPLSPSPPLLPPAPPKRKRRAAALHAEATIRRHLRAPHHPPPSSSPSPSEVDTPLSATSPLTTSPPPSASSPSSLSTSSHLPPLPPSSASSSSLSSSFITPIPKRRRRHRPRQLPPSPSPASSPVPLPPHLFSPLTLSPLPPFGDPRASSRACPSPCPPLLSLPLSFTPPIPPARTLSTPSSHHPSHRLFFDPPLLSLVLSHLLLPDLLRLRCLSHPFHRASQSQGGLAAPAPAGGQPPHPVHVRGHVSARPHRPHPQRPLLPRRAQHGPAAAPVQPHPLAHLPAPTQPRARQRRGGESCARVVPFADAPLPAQLPGPHTRRRRPV